MPKLSLSCHDTGSRDKPTIVMIHGAFGSWHDFELILPFFESDYHVLLPDLPRHGNSQHIEKFSTLLSADLIADIIRTRARNGKAHVVGFSLGAHVAVDLISKYSELVGDVFISGYQRLARNNLMPYGFWFAEYVEKLLPAALVRWLMDGTEFPTVHYTPLSLSLCKDIMGTVAAVDELGWQSPWPARTLIVCAGKSGIIPSADDPGPAMKLRDIGRQANMHTTAYVHPAMRHPWVWQKPDLFVETVKSWFERGQVPEGFVELN